MCNETWIWKLSFQNTLSKGNVDDMLVNMGYKAVYSVRNVLDNMASRPKNVFFFKKTYFEILRIFYL